MSNNDKFFESFKAAAREVEEQRFAGFEDVWQRVEQRLDEQPVRRLAWYRRPVWWGVAAAIVLLLGLLLWPAADEQATAPIAQQPTAQPPAPVPGTEPLLPAADDVVTVEPEKSNPSQRSSPALATQSRSAATRQPADEVPTAATAPRAEAVASTASAAPVRPDSLRSGVVKDATGRPLAGAMVSSSKATVVTDAQGRYSLPVSAEADSIQVNLIGYEPTALKAATADNDVVLQLSANTLSEVVVTGYSVKQKRDITGAVTSVNQRNFQYSASAPAQGLQGRVPGVQARGNAGVPGTGAQVRIRGAASVKGGQEPLYLVNGVPVSGRAFARLKPADIENVNVLKDASASSIYGSRAANGVVLVTTKDKSKAAMKRLQKLDEELLAAGKKLAPDPATVPAVPSPDESYAALEENAFVSPGIEPLSTFSIDVDNASYSNIRRFLNNGQPVPTDAVRVEEMMNYFAYQYPTPKAGEAFSISPEYADCPWNSQHKLLRIGIRARSIAPAQLPASHLVFLIDVSGSMSDENKLPLLKQSMKLLVRQLRAEDKVSIVVYAGAAGLVLPPTSGMQKAEIEAAIDRLNAGGSTAGGEGILLAYKTAREHFISGGNNRVVLATDGDFNVGLNSVADLQKLIAEQRESGVFLTCLGYGMGNYKDDRLETLADKGNGNYAYIDNMQEANKFLNKEFTGSMFTVAKDVKLQVEFNPKYVQAYRLIGYENRKLQAEDFANDKVDAGEMGSGHTVTALYEIIPAGVKSDMAPAATTLRYQQPTGSQQHGQEMALIKYRYKQPDGKTSTEGSVAITHEPLRLANSSEDFRFAVAVAWLGLKLRESTLIKEKASFQIIELARGATSFDPEGYRKEFLRLVQTLKQ